MENPQAAAVINNLRLLLDSPDLVQDLLDDARADLNLTKALLVDAAAYVNKCLATEAALRAFFPSTTDEERTDCAVLTQHVGLLLAEGSSRYDYFLKERWMLTQLVGLLLAVRAVASARSRAHLLPCVLLAAFSAAVLVYVSTWGGVVPGLRSFVRFSVMMLGFLFASDRPRGGGGG
jgi:hypothetical protein